MKFYDRKKELTLLEQTGVLSQKIARMTIITGRRRIGKTRLILKACEESKYVYLFVSRKSEQLLCREFTEEIESRLNTHVIGEIKSFSKLFEFLMIRSQTTPFTLIVDEFQEFYHINHSVFSEIQNIWDKYRQKSKMNLIFCGSVYSMMKRIFENSGEPLFGRADERIYLRPFTINVLKEIVSENHPTFKFPDLLSFYVITGGVPKYVELFTDKNLFVLKKMSDEIFRENSLLIEEGKNLLIEEFGKDYSTYFSILSLIASSRTSRPEIESVLEKNVGGYLDRLENDYNIIKRSRPIFSKPNARVQKYYIEDNFLNFWFRFVHKYWGAIEIGNYKYVRDLVQRDFDTFSGRFLEKYFREKIALSGKFNLVGNYWEKGNKNEIDIVAVNESEKKLLIAEVKLNEKNINIPRLKEKSLHLVNRLKSYEIQYAGFSLNDMV